MSQGHNRVKIVDGSTKYVCKITDLDKFLPDSGENNIKKVLQDLFDSSAWRMNYGEETPKEILSKYGIDLDKPRVRDAVALDIVKLDYSSVSNDSIYTYSEHKSYSRYEYERFLLNKNFRPQLASLAPAWSKVIHNGSVEYQQKRTQDVMYQGVRLSNVFLRFFNTLFKKGFNSNGTKKSGFVVDDLYVPFTNANDFTTEIALVPNTHVDFRPITSRAYYDEKYIKYLRQLKKYGIAAISTFALVDPDKDKNHTGDYLVKVQHRFGTKFGYIVARIDKDGKFKFRHDGKLDVVLIAASNKNTILCVCKEDVCQFDEFGNLMSVDRPSRASGTWNALIVEQVPMVKSTTSSHYSIFRQRIPNYDLKQVRHYLQFKTRLEGMELALEQLDRNVKQKEVQISDCFTKETLAIQRMFQEFTKNKPLMELVMKYYDLLAEYDELKTREAQLIGIKDEKREILNALVAEYNSLQNNQIDRKLALGQKIGSVKLELNKNILGSIKEIEERIDEIRDVDVPEINGKITDIIASNPNELSSVQKQKLNNVLGQFDEKKSAFEERLENKDFKDYYVDETKAQQEQDGRTDRIDDLEDSLTDPGSGSMWVGYNDHLADQRSVMSMRDDEDEQHPVGGLAAIKTGHLNSLVRQTEKWRNYMYNLGYELNQLKKMQTLCSDATIKVRRLVHNFAQKMADTEEQIWDSSHTLKHDFSFTSIASASLREIILLHDWYAANAAGKTYQEMGFANEEDFLEFRKQCNKVAFNLRKNQYRKSLLQQKEKLQKLIVELKEKIGNRGRLQYQDKYGWEAKKDEEKEWSIEDVSPEAIQRVRKFVEAWKEVNEEWKERPRTVDVKLMAAVPPKRKSGVAEAYSKLTKERQDEILKSIEAKKMKGRVMGYLKYLGLIQKESDIEKIATRKQAAQFEGDIQYEMWKLQQAKNNLEAATDTLTRQRQALQTLIDGVAKAEDRIVELTNANKKIFNVCIGERNRNIRNKLLMEKLDNEEDIMKLKMEVKRIKKENLEDFTSLENMRKNVDRKQEEYDSAVSTFKETIGVNQDTIDKLIVELYNKYKDEILSREKALELREAYGRKDNT